MRPLWQLAAEQYIGTKEYPGSESNPIIAGFWKLAKLSGIKDDAVPWCAGFACAMLEKVGYRSPRSDAAKSFLTWGEPLAAPELGCIAVMKRPGGYHVFFVVGIDKSGDLYGLGGNQGDKVCVALFKSAQVLSYRKPEGTTLSAPPVLAGVGSAVRSMA